MNRINIKNQQGHWVLAGTGKKVLRPGGKALTKSMLTSLKISPHDAIVEFAPGLGITANFTLKSNPKSYTGIEQNATAAHLLQKKITGENRTIIVSNASHTKLPPSSSDKVYGEAMLTMQAKKQKSQIIQEAYRILKKGGLYAIHEMGLHPTTPESVKSQIKQDLTQAIKVNANPMTTEEWAKLLEKEEFKVRETETCPFCLLEIKSIIHDEGFFSALKIILNVLTRPKTRKRVLEMRRVFRKHKPYLTAVTLIAEKS